MLKYTGALAAAVAGYGGTELLKPPPTPPPSFKPLLSPEVQSRVDAIIKGLIDKHAGEQEFTTGIPIMNGGMVKVRVKDGVLTSIEPWDGGINPNTGREDA